MPISEKDRQFMENVADYFRATKDRNNTEGSIRDTAAHFGVSRNKVRKILITTGNITSPVTEKAKALQAEGMSLEEIASRLGVSAATVSVYLPYTDTIKNGLDPTPHAQAVREYRAYEQNRAKRQVQNKNEQGERKMDTSCKGTGYEAMFGKALPSAPGEVSRLRLELVGYMDEEERETLRKYGNLKYGGNISRDVIVPSDIPLYAIHYMIQRLFGWQNSHLHRFELPEETLRKITEDKISTWARLVGVIFRSPFMDEEDEFWADDYEGGSFKNWLTKKYTGPYMSLCRGEGLIACREDMEEIFKEINDGKEYYVLYLKYSDDDERVVDMVPVYDAKGRKNPEPKWTLGHGETRVETVKLKDAPFEGLRFERGHADILERLPLNTVMSTDPEDFSGTKLLDSLELYISRVIAEQTDSPDAQVMPRAFTDTLYYNYDFGDNWTVKITVMNDCNDLVEQGRITQGQLDKAKKKCRELYRPVTLAVDGEMVMDDVGGLSGFVSFLRQINPELAGMSPAEKERARNEKEEMLEWARSVQNWKELNPMI